MEILSAIQVSECGVDEGQILIPKESIKLVSTYLLISSNPEDGKLKSKRPFSI